MYLPRYIEQQLTRSWTLCDLKLKLFRNISVKHSCLRVGWIVINHLFYIIVNPSPFFFFLHRLACLFVAFFLIVLIPLCRFHFSLLVAGTLCYLPTSVDTNTNRCLCCFSFVLLNLTVLPHYWGFHVASSYSDQFIVKLYCIKVE